MNKILTKLSKLIQTNEPAEDDYYEVPDMNSGIEEEPQNSAGGGSGSRFEQAQYQEEPIAVEPERLNRRRNRESIMMETGTGIGATTRSNVIGMPGVNSSASEVVVIEPHSFEEMPQVIQALRERRSVVLNLNVMDPDEAQRAVDFVAGGTYAIDGHQERIGESIFLFTPSCVKVSTLEGVIHDVHEPQPATLQTSAWASEASRIAQ